MEEATQRLWVRASPEVVEELLRDWSPPVRLRATRSDDGELQLTVREVAADQPPSEG